MSPMTPRKIRSLSPSELRKLFANLQADALPVGEFDGQAWSHDLEWVQAASRIWRGKVFTGTTVVNRLVGLRIVKGNVTLVGSSAWIDYPKTGLRDELKPIQAGLWLGRMQLGPSVIWFTLEQET